MPKQILIDWWRWWQRRWQWYMRCTLDCCCCCCQHPCHLRSLGKHFTLAVEEWDEVSCMPETHQLPSMVLPYSVQREQHQHWSLQKCHPKSDSRHIDADTLHRVWQIFFSFSFVLLTVSHYFWLGLGLIFLLLTVSMIVVVPAELPSITCNLQLTLINECETFLKLFNRDYLASDCNWL